MSEPAIKPDQDHSERAHTGNVVLLAVLLAAAWLFWSGMIKPLLLLFGAISCALVLIVSRRMHLFDRGVFQLRFMGRLLRFWAWLGREVIRSSLDVTRAVLNPRLPISPTMVEFDSHCEHPVDRAILGNSITLTPGTLTLEIEGRQFVVHALTKQGARDLMSGEMDRRIGALRSC